MSGIAKLRKTTERWRSCVCINYATRKPALAVSGKEGFAYVIINNDLENPMTVEIPGSGQLYALAGKDGMRSSQMTLNGEVLVAGPNGELPELTGKPVSGTVRIAPGSCAFLTL